MDIKQVLEIFVDVHIRYFAVIVVFIVARVVVGFFAIRSIGVGHLHIFLFR